MRGIILMGGSGTRLHLLTSVTSKQLLPVYDNPMVYFPLSMFMLVGVKDILSVPTPRDLPYFENLLEDGFDLDVSLFHTEEPEPNGLMQAFMIGEGFIAVEACRAYDVRYHHISTDEVYGGLALDDSRRFEPDDPHRPSSPYNSTKASSDLLIRTWHRTYGVHTTISNCSNNYCLYQHVEKFIPRHATSIICGARLKLYGDGRNMRDWIRTGPLACRLGGPHQRASRVTYLIGAKGERHHPPTGQLCALRDLRPRRLRARRELVRVRPQGLQDAQRGRCGPVSTAGYYASSEGPRCPVPGPQHPLARKARGSWLLSTRLRGQATE
ncbi:MAG: GDP-mannose 4,6-dehydratase [Coriobacteriales bacterium]|jgi:hypothetical protein